MKLELGQVYETTHSRKGTLRLMITDDTDSTWVSGLLMNRQEKGLQDRPKWVQGEEMTVRRVLCSTWKKVS